MRWKEGLVALALPLAALTGCKQQCFLTECDYKHYTTEMGLPPNLESPEVAVVPEGLGAPQPATIDDPQRPSRYLTLNEAIATAIERGRVGLANDRLLGTFDETLTSVPGISLTSVELSTDNIRVLALEPAFQGGFIEASLSKFDVQWNTSMTWQRTDQPSNGSFLTSFSNGDSATFTSSLLKPLPTGGVAGITFDTAYTFLSSPPAGVNNPTYRPTLQFQFEQPLLQGFGVEINQLRVAHPGSVLTPFPTNTGAEGILITRLEFDAQRAAFQTQLNYLVVNVEIAYWNLYGAYWTLYAREQGLRQAFEAWRFNKVRYEVGRISKQDLAQTRQQYELFRGQRLQALDTILESERQLRGLMGLPSEDGQRLIPIDSPTLTPYKPDWSSALNDALTRRPELFEMRQLVKYRQLDLIRNKNLLMPDLRFTSTYDVNGVGTHLDGGPDDPSNAFHSIATNDFHDWSFGLRLNVPIGFRMAQANVRQARLRLSQSYLVLRDQEDRARSFLTQQYRELASTYDQIQSLRALREATAVQLQARFEEYRAGKIILDVLQTAQQAWSQALSDEYNEIVQYNNTLARFEFAKGTLLEHDNIVIAENGLPQCAQVRAVEHERQRSKAIVLRERASPVPQGPCSFEKGSPGLPELPSFNAPSIPALYEGVAPAADLTVKPGSPKSATATPSLSDAPDIHQGRPASEQLSARLVPSSVNPAPAGQAGRPIGNEFSPEGGTEQVLQGKPSAGTVEPARTSASASAQLPESSSAAVASRPASLAVLPASASSASEGTPRGAGNSGVAVITLEPAGNSPTEPSASENQATQAQIQFSSE